jgi:hypothetical protein
VHCRRGKHLHRTGDHFLTARQALVEQRSTDPMR